MDELPYRILTRSESSEVNYYLNAADYGLLPGKITSDSAKNVFSVMISSKAEEYLCCGLKVISNRGIKYFQNKNLSYMSGTSRKDIQIILKMNFCR